jgi:protein TonB
MEFECKSILVKTAPVLFNRSHKTTFMTSNAILQSDVLDIVFENRYKLYGAYILRKFYKNRLLKSIGLMVFGVTIFVALTFLPGQSELKLVAADVLFGRVMPEVKSQSIKPKQPSSSRKSGSIKRALPGLPIVATDDPRDSIAQIDPVLNEGVFDKTPGATVEPGILMPEGYESVADESKGAAAEPDDNTPLGHADIMPEFPGGMRALRKYLERNLGNPRELDTGEKITVRAKFIVGFDGKLKGFNVVEDGGILFNNEVIRVLKKMPDWIPGKANGRNVSVYYTIPVKFISVD